jgi:dihydroorotate dehydrogenase (fumarate)
VTDLSTTYLGLTLRSPLVASASPMTGDLAQLRALDAAGTGAVVLPSLFEEQIVHEQVQTSQVLDLGDAMNPEAASGFYYDLEGYNTGPIRYLRHITAAKRALGIPVIASLNGTTRGGWVRYARMMQDAGADAVELNIYRVVADIEASSRQVEDEFVDLVRAVADEIEIPLAVKLGPFFTAFAHTARELVAAGAGALVLFNRFYQPDIDLETLEVGPNLVLSGSDELRLPLRWIAILHGRLDADLAATTGIHTGRDALKALLAGATVTMMTSALLRHGPDHVADIEAEMLRWMVERAYGSVGQLRGSMSQAAVSDPSQFERANYMRTLTAYAPTFS